MLGRLSVTARCAALTSGAHARRPLVTHVAAAARRLRGAEVGRPLACAPAPHIGRPLSGDAKKAAAATAKAEDGADVDDLVPLTPAQKLGVGINLSAWAAGLSLAAVCAYYIVRELLPSRMSPNSVFDAAFAAVSGDDRVARVYGEPLKGYGRDHGGHREGRRNFIENTPYVDEKDGSKRLRVRFNIKGPYSEGFVFAEISDATDGFVYLMVQDKRTGRVITIQDNRLAMQASAGIRSDAERSALAGLIGGTGGGGPPKF